MGRRCQKTLSMWRTKGLASPITTLMDGAQASVPFAMSIKKSMA
ncbi:hypothetical protein NitYY0918_C0228 [Nitratiruptor sp. YY09-18]|nr:hypothetical protein NitYY0918_C0228 [Nitratiruptor sp. YY09-18]